MTRRSAGADSEPSPEPTIRWNDEVRLVISDVDETIAGLYEPASIAMIQALSSYLADGRSLVLVTGGSLERVTGGITDAIAPELRPRILIAPVSGAEVWGFRSDGALHAGPLISPGHAGLSTEANREWRRVTAQLIAEFGLRPHPVRPLARFFDEVGDDPRDVIFDDRRLQITFEFVNGHDLSPAQAATLPFPVPSRLGRSDMRIPVLERAAQLLSEAGIPVTPRLAGVFALNLTLAGVSKTLAVTEILRDEATLAGIGLTPADIAEPTALEVWGDDFNPATGGTDLHMSLALPPAVRSIDFRAEDPVGLRTDRNVVLWDGAHRLQHGVLEYLQARDTASASIGVGGGSGA